MIVFVKCETSDLLKKQLPPEDPGQPWPTVIAADLCEDDGKTFDFFQHHIRANNRKIRPGATEANGLSTRIADKRGVAEILALGDVSGYAAQALTIVGYNYREFDSIVLTGALVRLQKNPRILERAGLIKLSLIQIAAQACKIPTVRDDQQYKWPTLDEACKILLDEEPPGDCGWLKTWADCQRIKRLYFNLKGRGVIETMEAA